MLLFQELPGSIRNSFNFSVVHAAAGQVKILEVLLFTRNEIGGVSERGHWQCRVGHLFR